MFKNVCIYAQTYVHVTAINKKKRYEPEREQGVGIWKGLKGGKIKG